MKRLRSLSFVVMDCSMQLPHRRPVSDCNVLTTFLQPCQDQQAFYMNTNGNAKIQIYSKDGNPRFEENEPKPKLALGSFMRQGASAQPTSPGEPINTASRSPQISHNHACSGNGKSRGKGTAAGHHSEICFCLVASPAERGALTSV